MINFLQEIDSYIFIRAVAGFGFGGAVLAMFSYGYVLLKRDNYQLVSESDFRLYILAYIQVFLLIVEWCVVQVSLVEYPFRIVKLVLNISITMTFLYYILDEVYTASIEKAFKFSISGSAVLLLFMLFDKSETKHCGHNFWELYDLTYIASSAIIMYIGSKAISDITAIENQNMNQPSDPIAKQISLQLIRNQKNNYFIMILGISLGCAAFVTIDVMKFFRPSSEQLCSSMFSEKSLFTKIVLVLVELLANLLPMMTIFYVYVAKNWSLLTYNLKPDLSVSEACDSIRSRLIYERELEDHNKYKEHQGDPDFKITF